MSSDEIAHALKVAQSGLMPKQDTQADTFIQEHPEWDGRGITVAIFDTGIDPGAVGLQTCPDGRPKVLDVVDCTGSGDVNTTTELTAETAETASKGDGADANVLLKGLSGRSLRLNASWTNPSGKWRVGILEGFKVFSRALTRRYTRERREKWDKVQEQAKQHALKSLQSFDKANADPGSTAELRMQRASLVHALEVLETLQKDYKDPGPMFDVVAWFDGTKWRAAVDTSETGDLTDATAFTNFADERQWGTFSSLDLCNFAINIYDDGNLVSVVVAAGAHGSHVAGIVAAHDPEHPEFNGIAPGAQIVCCKIGDSRLGSMETGLGLERAANTVLRNKCDIVNMSYGEPVADPHGGRVIDVIRELVRRHEIIFVTSAGNAGPALTTVGAPASSCSSDVIAVGAYVSPHMMEAQYSLKNTPPPINFTWSSRGPTRLGTTGVSICAPGGAMSSCPTWTLQRNMHMNGTSMASPNACGGITLILSALKAQNIKYTPPRIRRACENTARIVPGVEPLSQGCGLLQVAAAFQHVVDYADSVTFGLKMNVRCNGMLGVYLREPHEVCGRPKFSAKVHVSAHFHPDASQELKTALDSQVALVHSKPWAKVPAFYHLQTTRGFELSVDMDAAKRSDPQKGVHYAEIHGFDTSLPRQAGPLFRVPITYLSPVNDVAETTISSMAAAAAASPLRYVFSNLTFSPGQIHRKIVHVPTNASRFTIMLRPSSSWGGGDEGLSNRIMTIHCQQLVPQRIHGDTMLEQYIYFNRSTTKTLTARCEPGRTMEIVIAQFWNSNVGDSSADVEVEFSGVQPQLSTFGSGIVVEAKQGFARVDVSAPWGAASQALSPVREKILDKRLHK
jgi:tripeptidyl-peptidase-2